VDVEIPRQLFHRLGKWEYLWLCLLVLAILAMHFSIISQPTQPIFDEEHYVSDAGSILQGQGTLRPEHPPLGKLLIVSGIFLFGDNPFGWRFFSVVFGAICIVLFYLVCRQLAMPKRASFLATFLLALDNLSFVQASVAMLDVFSLAFMLGAFWLYLKGRYLLSGFSVGLSTLAKLSGALALPVILLHWLLTRRTRPRRFVASMLLAPASFLLLMPLFDFVVSGQLLNSISRVKTMLSLSSSLTFANTTYEAVSRPWDWILRPEIMAYWYEPHYIGTISFTIWALIIPSVLYMAFRATKGDSAGLFGISWFIGTYLFWIPASIITDRISFIYYFYPTVGAICIGLGLGLSQLIAIWETKDAGKLRWVAMLAVVGYLLLHVGVFVAVSPVFSWWELPFLG
jgi:predicted membrane-bound dolichyl-phosphate-mannose-protein mannosyltransferase